jgi:dipeptidyl aminopeptidase/acylaminoacyl peptidase
MSAWLLDLARGIPEELPLDRNAHLLVWLPDGARLAFSSDRDGAANIFIRDAGGSGASEKFVTGSQHADPGSWSRDGRWLAYAETSPLTSRDLWKYDTAAHQASLFLRTEARDGRSLFFVSGSRLMRVGITDGPALALEKPVPMFDVGAYLAASTYGPAACAVTPDGGAFHFV